MKIVIAGYSNEGKTTLALAIAKMLEEHDFTNVKIEIGEEEDERELLSKEEHLHELMDKIKDNQIVIETKQLRRLG